MGRRERLLYPIVGIVVVIAIVLGVVILAPPQPAGPQVAPNFTLTSSDGERVRLWDLQGSVILLDFMDTDCSHCQQETPAVLRPLHAAYGDRVVFLSVDVGFIGPPDDFDDIRSFKTNFGASWTYVLDDGSVAPKYSVSSTPTTYILRGNLSVHSHFVGSSALSTLSSALDAALGGG
jgi:cytochrome oxidase Cu insertion factor (SCO1/SenC/PrrC family)